MIADRDLWDRFWSKVDKSGDCWMWRAGLYSNGYGAIGVGRSSAYVHRLAYQWLRGPIPDDLTIDHLCRNKACVRPEHMELVTAGENARRATYFQAGSTPDRCRYGHPRTLGKPCRGCRERYNARRRNTDHVVRARAGAGQYLSSAGERRRLGRILLDWEGHGYSSLEAAVLDLFGGGS